MNLLCLSKLHRCVPECYLNARSCKYKWRHKEILIIFLGNISRRIGRRIGILSLEKINKCKVIYWKTNNKSFNLYSIRHNGVLTLWSHSEKPQCLTRCGPSHHRTSSHLVRRQLNSAGNICKDWLAPTRRPFAKAGATLRCWVRIFASSLL